ncbi:MAG: precorrin-6A synthase (deacetylating) [Acidimicrobiia bacterium]
MKKLFVIGIGAGHPEHVTVQAINAMNTVDVFFVMDKGGAKEDLVRIRKEICERYITNASYRIVEVRDPERDRSSPAYQSAVEAWYERRVDVYERLVDEELDDDGCGAFLVWGDPSLYDGTLRVIERVLGRGKTSFDYVVVPGITSVQALAARHRISLSRVGESIQITTGRRLAEAGLPDGVANVVVMLDRGCSFTHVTDDGVEIYWGAYLGTDDEILDCGTLSDRAEAIEHARGEARSRKGWIMDTYLLRRSADA